MLAPDLNQLFLNQAQELYQDHIQLFLNQVLNPELSQEFSQQLVLKETKTQHQAQEWFQPQFQEFLLLKLC